MIGLLCVGAVGIGAVLVMANAPCYCDQNETSRVLEKAAGVALIVIGMWGLR